MKLNRRRMKRARARRHEKDRLIRESILPVAGPDGQTLGMIAAIGEGAGRRYFVVREGLRGYMLQVSDEFLMIGAALRCVTCQHHLAPDSEGDLDHDDPNNNLIVSWRRLLSTY